jgi:hypothetical protein
MVNKKKGIPKGVVRPAVNAGTGAFEKVVKDTLSDDSNPDNGKQAYKSLDNAGSEVLRLS